MPSPPQHEILARLREYGREGVALGALVDTLVERGLDDAACEAALWQLLADGRVLVRAFVRRDLRPPRGQARAILRTYEPIVAVAPTPAPDGAPPRGSAP